MRMLAQRRSRGISSKRTVSSTRSTPFAVLSDPFARKEIEYLREIERQNVVSAEKMQLRANRLAWLYQRDIKIDTMLPADVPYKALHNKLGWQRGRQGVVPSRANLELRCWKAFIVSVAIADALIKRDWKEDDVT